MIAAVRQKEFHLSNSMMPSADGLFHHPVSIATEGCQRYYQIIKKPIDLETMEKKNSRSEYKSIAAFNKDMELLFANCYKFNKVKIDGIFDTQNAIIPEYARKVEEYYKILFVELQKKDLFYNAEYNREPKRLCPLCHGSDYLLEGQSLHCSGECREVIELNKRYYIDKTLQHVWCENCYKLLKDEFLCDDVLIKKMDLTIRMNKHTEKEEWVQCNHCQTWYHCVCVLYNGKICRQGNKLVFHCPLCIQDLKETLKCPNRQLFLPRADGRWCVVCLFVCLFVCCCCCCCCCCCVVFDDNVVMLLLLCCL